jgi:hypothetical protein
MNTVEAIIEQARQLSPQERWQLVKKLEALLVEEPATQPDEGPYARSLALAGTARSDFTDVSADKYQHLAEAYTDKDNEK